MNRPSGAWLVLALALSLPAPAFAAAIDFSAAKIAAPPGIAGPEAKAVEMLVEEIERRSAVRLPRVEALSGDAPLIVVGTAEQLRGLRRRDAEAEAGGPPQPPDAAESFAVRSSPGRGRPVLWIAGRDARGVLYGIGYLLRHLAIEPDRISLPAPLDIASAPRLKWRGHQLGYRPKTNSYDGWEVADWERYIRDLVVFGCNAIELVPPRSDDIPSSPHFPLPPLRMMREMSRLAAEYGIECWIWYPALDHDYADAATAARAEREWRTVFSALPRVDAVFVPGGDPGTTPPRALMGLLERQARVLHEYHPGAGMWVSPQGFSAPWLKEWLEVVRQRPSWLTGVVYGPWTRLSLPQLRAAVPSNYPLRLYPDITHTFLCQFPVPEWDQALASTYGREPIAPRPKAMAAILRSEIASADGFISYSEGCNDDVNKAVWSAVSWNPDVDVAEVLREYGRYYVAPEIADRFAQGLLALEENWRGPLAANAGIEPTLRRFQELERSASPRLLHNWRFLQALYRAYFDAYQQRRLRVETAAEQRGVEILSRANETDEDAGIGRAGVALQSREREMTDPRLAGLRTRIFQLAEALFQTIKMQLSVPLYRAEAVPRGADLDTVDLPLNDRGWLKSRLAAVAAMPAARRSAAVREIVHWRDPGPGGFYDDLGDSAAEPHLDCGDASDFDPEYRRHPLVTHTVRTGEHFENWRASWWKHVSAFYGSSVALDYPGLDASAHYRVKVVYVPTPIPARVRLTANGRYEVHPFLDPGREPRVREFAVPAEATRGGTLRLEWSADPDAGNLVGFGQIAEVWLLKVPAISP